MASTAVENGNVEAIDARRIAILRAADGLLGEQGLEGLTIRAVLARTNLARRAFYDMFATKDDLVLALFEHTLASAAEQLAEEGAKLPGPAERLARIVRSIVATESGSQPQDSPRRDRRSAAFSREHLRLAQARPEDLQRAIRPLVDLIRRIIEEGIAAGQWHSPSADRSARFVYNLVSTTVHTEMLDPGARRLSPGEREELAAQLTQFCTKALSAA